MTNINCKRITITRGELMQWLVLQNLLQYYLLLLLRSVLPTNLANLWSLFNCWYLILIIELLWARK